MKPLSDVSPSPSFVFRFPLILIGTILCHSTEFDFSFVQFLARLLDLNDTGTIVATGGISILSTTRMVSLVVSSPPPQPHYLGLVAPGPCRCEESISINYRNNILVPIWQWPDPGHTKPMALTTPPAGVPRREGKDGNKSCPSGAGKRLREVHRERTKKSLAAGRAGLRTVSSQWHKVNVTIGKIIANGNKYLHDTIS